MKVRPTVLEMPSRHEEWLVLPSWNVLHRICEIAPDAIGDGLPNGEGRALCGATGHFSVPGVFSRMGLRRCAHCCDRLGIPRGDGNTLNGGIEEGARIPVRRWEHYEEIVEAWAP